MGRKSDYNIRSFESGDEGQVIDVVTKAFDALSKDLWVWKYLENPGFDRSLVFIAENNGEVIGCMHYLPRELKISRSLKVKGALGADFAVRPDYRGRGIGSSMLRFSRSSGVLEKKGIVLTFGFVDHRRAKFYRRNIESVTIPVSTVMYKKFFDASPIERRLLSLSRLVETESMLLKELRESNISVLFRLVGVPPFMLKVEDGEISIDGEETAHPDVTVEGDPYLLESFYDGDKGILDLMIGVLKGKIRIRGGVRKIFKFYKIVKTIRRLSPLDDQN